MKKVRSGKEPLSIDIRQRLNSGDDVTYKDVYHRAVVVDAEDVLSLYISLCDGFGNKTAEFKFTYDKEWSSFGGFIHDNFDSKMHTVYNSIVLTSNISLD